MNDLFFQVKWHMKVKSVSLYLNKSDDKILTLPRQA